MSRNKTNELAQEVHELAMRYGSDSWHFVEAMLQLVDREKIIALNRYLRNRGEPELIPEPTRYKDNNNLVWFIDVPKEWISLTGRD